jgi:LysR family transcriptional regulator, glycine cleavage system transcriptional activator
MLRAFEAAARHGSFREAALELGLTGSAVSHAIDSLEKWVGVSLFERGARRVTLTRAGTDYLPYVSEGLALLSSGLSRLPHASRPVTLRISAAPTFANAFLLPRLHIFHARCPGIELTVDSSFALVNVGTDGTDLAIRHGRGKWPNMRATLLFTECLVPICSRTYLAEISDPTGRIDWSRVAFIHTSTFPSDWKTWMSHGPISVEAKESLTFDRIEMAVRAAAASLGVAMGRVPISLLPHIGTAGLTTAIEDRISLDEGYWIIEPEGRAEASPVREFKQWLLEITSDYRNGLTTCGRPGSTSTA